MHGNTTSRRYPQLVLVLGIILGVLVWPVAFWSYMIGSFLSQRAEGKEDISGALFYFGITAGLMLVSSLLLSGAITYASGARAIWKSILITGLVVVLIGGGLFAATAVHLLQIPDSVLMRHG